MEVEHINQIRVRKTRSSSDCFATWSLKELTQKSTKEWLIGAMRKSGNADLAISLWAHYPNLRAATEKLTAYISPNWPAANGEGLLLRSISAGVDKVQMAFAQGDSYAPRVIALYLAGLASSVDDVMRVGVYGCARSGEMEFWDYFSEPLQAWAIRNGMSEVEAHLVNRESKLEEILGMKYHLISKISDPVDTGYFAVFAPPLAPGRA